MKITTDVLRKSARAKCFLAAKYQVATAPRLTEKRRTQRLADQNRAAARTETAT